MVFTTFASNGVYDFCMKSYAWSGASKKMLGAALDKNILQVALCKKLCLERRQQKNAGCCVR